MQTLDSSKVFLQEWSSPWSHNEKGIIHYTGLSFHEMLANSWQNVNLMNSDM